MSRRRSDFKTVRLLGAASANGGFNRGVYLVKSKASGTKYIEKRISHGAITTGHAKREVKAMLEWDDHPNIIRIVGFDMHDYAGLGYGSIFMQHCELGSIDGIIEQYSTRGERLADEGFLWRVFWDISIALASSWTGRSAAHVRERALAGKATVEMDEGTFTRLIHRDIKPANLFLTGVPIEGRSNYYPRAVLGDWGCSASSEDVLAGRVDANLQTCVTQVFAPPENPKYYARSDVYQLALSIHCLACMSQKPDLEGYPPHDPVPSRYKDRGLRKLLGQCLQHRPLDRPRSCELPMKVFQGMNQWMKWHGAGEKLPRWACK